MQKVLKKSFISVSDIREEPSTGELDLETYIKEKAILSAKVSGILPV